MEDRQTMRGIFERFDTNGNGTISKEEFSQVMKQLDEETWTQERVDKLLKIVVDKANDKIDFESFLGWLFSSDGKEVRSALYGLQYSPLRHSTDSDFFAQVQRWAEERPEAVARLVFQDDDDASLCVEMWGARVQIFLPSREEPFFLSTTDDWEMCPVLSELNELEIADFPEFLTQMSALLEDRLLKRTESMMQNGIEPAEGELQPLTLFREQSALITNLAGTSQMQRDIVARVASATGLGVPAARLLLVHAGWDEDELLREFRESRSELLAAAGVGAEAVAPPDGALCAVCFCDPPDPALACGHGLCSECWPEFLKCNLESGTVDGQNCLRLKCPGELCSIIVPPNLFERFLTPADYARYEQLLSLSFARSGSIITKCPNPKCELYVAGSQRKSTVACQCGSYFCFCCGLDAHEPVSCQFAARWMRPDLATEKSLKKSTVKPCPNPACAVPVFKDSGCMFMTCKMCKENWCWMCGHWGGGPSGRDEPHHVWKCNDPMNQNWNATVSTFYRHRYKNHLDALAFAQDLRRVVKYTGEAIGLQGAELALVCRAAERLVEYRSFLAWSYPWLYFEESRSRRSRFEEAQDEMERLIERLSSMLEGDPKNPRAGWLWVSFGVGGELQAWATEITGGPAKELSDRLDELDASMAKMLEMGLPSVTLDPGDDGVREVIHILDAGAAAGGNGVAAAAAAGPAAAPAAAPKAKAKAGARRGNAKAGAKAAAARPKRAFRRRGA